MFGLQIPTHGIISLPYVHGPVLKVSVEQRQIWTRISTTLTWTTFHALSLIPISWLLNGLAADVVVATVLQPRLPLLPQAARSAHA